MKSFDDRFDATNKVLPTNHCPACNNILDAATSMNSDARPGPGDVTLCINCASLLEFNNNMELVLASEETKSSLPAETMDQISHFRDIITNRLMH